MFLAAWIVAVLSLATCVLSLEMRLTPKERNVTQGRRQTFHYLPKNNITTNVAVLDTLTNKTIPVTDNATHGQFNWTVPEHLEVRGGYFFQLRQQVNNATLTVSSNSEFQVLKKPEPSSTKPTEPKSEAMSRSADTVTLGLFVGIAFLGTLFL